MTLQVHVKLKSLTQPFPGYSKYRCKFDLNIYVSTSSLSNHIGCNAVVSSSIIFGYISNGQYISFDDRRLHTISIFWQWVIVLTSPVYLWWRISTCKTFEFNVLSLYDHDGPSRIVGNDWWSTNYKWYLCSFFIRQGNQNLALINGTICFLNITNTKYVGGSSFV